MLPSSNPVAALAVAATVLAASAVESPSPARASTPSTLYGRRRCRRSARRGAAAPRSPRLSEGAGTRRGPHCLRLPREVGRRREVGRVAGSHLCGARESRSRVRSPFEGEARTRPLLTRGRPVLAIAKGLVDGTGAAPVRRGRRHPSHTDAARPLRDHRQALELLALVLRVLRHRAFGSSNAFDTGLDRRRSPGDPRWQRGRGCGSNGCLRAAETDMHYLMSTLPLGTQVVVHD